MRCDYFTFLLKLIQLLNNARCRSCVGTLTHKYLCDSVIFTQVFVRGTQVQVDMHEFNDNSMLSARNFLFEHIDIRKHMYVLFYSKKCRSAASATKIHTNWPKYALNGEFFKLNQGYTNIFNIELQYTSTLGRFCVKISFTALIRNDN